MHLAVHGGRHVAPARTFWTFGVRFGAHEIRFEWGSGLRMSRLNHNAPTFVQRDWKLI